MANITAVTSQMIFDSRSHPTIESTVLLDNGIGATSAVPSGASTGAHEAKELRDGNDEWQGLGVSTAVSNVKNVIGPAVVGQDVSDQKKIDRIMIDLDGTSNKSKLGANAILSVSQAVAKASAASSQMPVHQYIKSMLVTEIMEKLPTPLYNIIEGGVHASNRLNFQEFLIIPATSKSFNEKIKIGIDVYQALKRGLMERSMSTSTADEGGFSPEVINNVEALNMIKSACDKAGYKFSLEVFAGIDFAANHYFSKNQKQYKLIDVSNFMKATELTEYYTNLFNDYGLLYMEDPFAEDDIDGWKTLAQQLVAKTLIVGDDLTTTNPYRLQMAIDNNLINSIVIKPNQIGTVTETIAVVEMARYKNMKIIVANRSGETQDTFIADLAVGVGADYVKFGAPARERIFKYNRLLQIQSELSTTS